MLRRWLAAALVSLSLIPLAAFAKERSEVDAKYKWDLTALYKSEAAWATAKADLEKRVAGMEKFRGHLGASADSLYRALAFDMDLQNDLQHLAAYASQLGDEDARIARHVEMRHAADQLGVKLGAATSFLRPEILAVGATKIRGFIDRDKRLVPYRPYLEDVLRYAPHTRSAAEEEIIAQAGRMAGAGYAVRDIFNNAELPWPSIQLSSGEKVRLDDAAYTQYRQAVNRADRDSVFQAFWRAHRDFQGTYGAALDAGVQAHVFDKDVHHFNSCVEDALFRDNIPPRVYTQLIADVNANLPTLHRYLRLMKRMLGVQQLRYEDLYTPVIKSVDLHYTPEQAMDIVLDAVKPLGQAYVDTLSHGFHSGWIDWMPTTGKASGAYSNGAYGVHPYQLQNFTGMYDEIGTLAHESGHSMHTYLANSHQPYVTHDYATFVAEVASTLNENLLFHRMLDHTTDKNTRLFLLGSYLDNLRGTLFRQTMFAEFELAIHEKAEKGEALTGENLSKLYLDIVRKYYGHAKGVCLVDSLYGVEWAYIPHFYYNFYVYQYSTSIVASTALAGGIRAERAAGGGTAKRDAYLHMLESGSSKYPVDLLKGAGVDMTTSAPFQAAIREMNAVMDEMEKLLAKP